MVFCFVVLHYLTDKDTIQCIESIEALNVSNNINVIVVDNFSNNGSIEKVERFAEQYSNCVIIKNHQNLGFAKGNNIGYKYAKGHFDNPFIIILNNDTIIRQADFLVKIQSRFEKERYAVLGPDIVSLIDGGHQNPLCKVPDKKTVVKQIFRYRCLLLFSVIGIYNLLQTHFGSKKSGQGSRTKVAASAELKNVALHGACLVFSPEFVEKMDKAFCPDTFLYKEELILAKICENKNLKMYYDAEIEILHKEDSSTNQVVSSQKAKREFLFRNLIKSNKVLLRYL